MTTIKVFTKQEVENIHENSNVSMYSYFNDTLKVENSSSRYDDPKHQLALIYAIEKTTESDVVAFKEEYKKRLQKDTKEITELEEKLERYKANLVEQTKLFAELKKMTSMKDIFVKLSKQSNPQ